jgi:hypothetical protein
VVFEQLDVPLADHAGRAQNANWIFCFHSLEHSSVQENGMASANCAPAERMKMPQIGLFFGGACG